VASPSDPGAPLPTISDVARRAAVSRATVSRVLNGNPHVDGPTRLRVEHTIAELGFAPSQPARRLSLGRIVAVDVLVDLADPLAVERLRGAETALAAAGFDTVVHDGSPDRAEALLRRLLEDGRPRPVVILHDQQPPRQIGSVDGAWVVSARSPSGPQPRIDAPRCLPYTRPAGRE
jgi:DNA-binding LacI/PurR family transcriptional regulator